MANITLTRLTEDDREQFISDNQRAFKYGAMEEFGCRDDHMEEDGEIISRRTIEESIDGGVAYRIRISRQIRPESQIRHFFRDAGHITHRGRCRQRRKRREQREQSVSSRARYYFRRLMIILITFSTPLIV